MASKTVLSIAAQLIAAAVYLIGMVRRMLAGRPRNTGPIDPAGIRSIAIIRLDEMGDFVISSAMLRPLREAFPKAHISLVLCDWIAPLAAVCPYIDEVIPFPSAGPRWRQFLLGPWRALRVASRLDRPIDLVINPRFDRDVRGAAFLAHFTGAPFVIGYPSSTDPVKAIINCGYDHFYTHLLPVEPGGVHELERGRTVLRYLGIRSDGMTPKVWTSLEDRHRAEAILRHEGWRPGDLLVALGIGASLPRRRWPVESFIEVAKSVASSTGARFLVVGSAADRASAERMRPALGSSLINLAGTADLQVSASVLAHCSLYVGNDSGPMHIAAAVGIPVVELSCHARNGDEGHFQSPARFGPLAPQSIVLSPAESLAPCRESCTADHAHCITLVSVGQVVEAVNACVPTPVS